MDAKRTGWDCAADGCDSTVEDGYLERVNPKGRPGIFMCAEHRHFVNSWEQRLVDFPAAPSTPEQPEGGNRG